MENQYQKIVNISYLIFSGLVAFIVLTVLMKLANTYDLESKVQSIEYIIRGASILVGAILFVILYKHSKVNTFMNEVTVELLTKVTWPTTKDTVSATVVVIITVIIAGLILGLFDWLWSLALRWVL